MIVPGLHQRVRGRSGGRYPAFDELPDERPLATKVVRVARQARRPTSARESTAADTTPSPSGASMRYREAGQPLPAPNRPRRSPLEKEATPYLGVRNSPVVTGRLAKARPRRPRERLRGPRA